MQKLIDEVRGDKDVGRGTCSPVDECFSDAELIEIWTEAGVKTPAQALEWAYYEHGIFLDQSLNARWGEDDDPQLIAHEKWFGKS